MSDFFFVRADFAVCNRVVFEKDEVAVKFVKLIDSVDLLWDGGEIKLVDDPDEETLDGCDVLSLFECMLIITDRAKLLCEAAVSGSTVEWIPVKYKGNQWWILRSREMIQGILESESVLVRAGVRRVMEIEHLVLDADVCRGHDFFRLAGGLESWCQVVSARVRDSWLLAGVRGLSFFPIFASKKY